ncbi:MAG: phosphate ABC transporter permease PstA [Cytophagales bacterium]|nr:MAG: phosphate ABC transporter permease PstA [Cytophagales bacterium]
MSKSKFYLIQDEVFKYFGLFCTILGIAVLIVFLFNLFVTAGSRIDWGFLTNLPSRRAAKAGIYTAWVGTLWILVLTTIIALPIGIAAGVYLEEYNKKNRFSSLLEVNIANLAGVPSIVYGLLGLELFARFIGTGESLLTGALTLALLILPVIIVSTREALKTVPYTIREASYALGATKWQTIWNQVLPASLSGIFTGMILALSRAVGETAPLIVIGALAFVPFVPTSVFDSFTVLPIQIFNWVSRPQKEFSVNAAAAIIVLLSITFMMNGIAVYLRHRWQKKIKW